MLLRGTDLNLWPIHDAATAIAEFGYAGNVDTVMVDGILRKRDGHLLEDPRRVAALRDRLAASARRIMAEAEVAPGAS